MRSRILGSAVSYREFPAEGPDSAGYRAALQLRQGKAACEVLLARVGVVGEPVFVIGDVPRAVLRGLVAGDLEDWAGGPLVMRRTEAGLRVAGTPGGSPALSGGLALPAEWVRGSLSSLEAELRRERYWRVRALVQAALGLAGIVGTLWLEPLTAAGVFLVGAWAVALGLRDLEACLFVRWAFSPVFTMGWPLFWISRGGAFLAYLAVVPAMVLGAPFRFRWDPPGWAPWYGQEEPGLPRWRRAGLALSVGVPLLAVGLAVGPGPWIGGVALCLGYAVYQGVRLAVEARRGRGTHL